MQISTAKKSNDKPYVKSDLTTELNNALEIVRKKLGNSRSSVVNSALEYYFKNLFPGALPPSSDEILQKVRMDFLKSQTTKQYELIQLGTDSLKDSEEWVSRIETEIKTLENQNHLKEKSLETTKDKKKKAEIEIDISHIKQGIENKKMQLSHAKNTLEAFRSGKQEPF